MTGRTFVDTSALWACLDARDERHAMSETLARFPRWLTTNYVVDELLTLALARRGARAALRLAEHLWCGQVAAVEWVSEDDERRARELFVRFAAAGASFTDCTSFAVIERLRVAVALSFDRHFALPGTFIVRP